MRHFLKGRLLRFILGFLFCSTLLCISNLDIVNDLNYFDDALLLHEEDNVLILTKKDNRGRPWCISEVVLPFNKKMIISSLKSFENYSNIFKRISTCKIVSDNVVHIRLDMPYFISDRDYIVEYTMIEQKGKTIFAFDSGSHGSKPLLEKSIRLPNASGAWVLEFISESSTKVSYIWNGELLGDFPDWALENAWKTQGQEVFVWMEDYLSKK